MPTSTPAWVKDAVFYQIFPDRFARSDRLAKPQNLDPWGSPPTVFGFQGGDLVGVTEHLDYLSGLGVNAIYFTPIFSSAANHRYHTYDYFNVDPLLGGNVALRELLDAAHARNIRIVLDGVFNHASRGLWQFHHTLENGAASPYVDWFHFDPDRLTGKRHFAAYPDPAARQALRQGVGSRKAIGYRAWWDLPALPKFNTDTPAVREFLWNVATYWVEFGIDGWRLDVPTEIDDDAFWQEFRRRVKAVNPEVYLVGEIWHESQRWLQGDQFDAVMNYPLTGACLGFFGGEQLDLNQVRQPGGFRHIRALDAQEFAGQIDAILSLYDPAVTFAQLNLLDSHDTARFLTCVGRDQSAFRLAWLFLCTMPGAPCLYYGDEIGLDGGNDPACRKAFPWAPASWDHDLLAYVTKCIALRHRFAALRHGTFTRLYTDNGVYIFQRILDDEVVMIALNVADAARQVDVSFLKADGHFGRWQTVWDNNEEVLIDGDLPMLEIKPRSSAILIPA